MSVKLRKKKTALYPKIFSMRVSEEAKAMVQEMTDFEFDIAGPVREVVEPSIKELYKQFLKERKSS